MGVRGPPGGERGLIWILICDLPSQRVLWLTDVSAPEINVCSPVYQHSSSSSPRRETQALKDLHSSLFVVGEICHDNKRRFVSKFSSSVCNVGLVGNQHINIYIFFLCKILEIIGWDKHYCFEYGYYTYDTRYKQNTSKLINLKPNFKGKTMTYIIHCSSSIFITLCRINVHRIFRILFCLVFMLCIYVCMMEFIL